MADNYLITGYWGEPHVTAENDRGINAAMFGAGRFVLPVGKQFNVEYIGNNTVRLYDGKLMDNGAAAGIPVGEYIDFTIANAGQGKKRNDLIIFQYSQDASTLIESGVFTVIKGTETTGTASDPALTQADLLSGQATFDQMALWRIPVSGTTISAPVKLFSTSKDIPGLEKWANGALAPAGYGLGEYLYSDKAQIVDNFDDATKTGWYAYFNSGTVINGISANGGMLEVMAYTAGRIRQIYYPFGSLAVFNRFLYEGTWSNWETGITATNHGNHVPTTETANNARFLRNDNTWQSVTPANIGAVPTNRTVNGKALSSDVTLSASDVGARSDTWTPTASDVGAVPTTQIPAFTAQGFTVPANGSVKFRVASQLLMIGRYNANATSPAVYAFSAYNEYRAPVVSEITAGTYITVATGGDNSSGWYIEVTNIGATTASFYVMGNCIPNFI